MRCNFQHGITVSRYQLESVPTPPASYRSESLYVIVRSSCGALIGLQFVVLTLVAESRAVRIESPALSAFTTSTVSQSERSRVEGARIARGNWTIARSALTFVRLWRRQLRSDQRRSAPQGHPSDSFPHG